MPLSIAVGVIAAFSGGLGNVPSDWQLCDGTNGTPDLRDKFVPSAGPSFSVGDSGGAVSHDHVGAIDGHTHDVEFGTSIAIGTDIFSTSSSKHDAFVSDDDNHLAPYYALAYIQYLGP